jgi:hypothetical protein
MQRARALHWPCSKAGCKTCNSDVLMVSYKNSGNDLPYGTGSQPLPPQGWQRLIRLSANQKPLKGPYFLKASNA